MIGVWILLGVAVLGGLWWITTYNRLIRLRLMTGNAWSDIDVQLKRRHDLIPNVVETVKGYAAHERTTFEKVVEARTAAMGASTPAQRAEAENILTGALKSLFALAENYPALRASENFMNLQGQLSQIEEAIQNARRYYNAVVRDYNSLTQYFPSSIVANAGGFRPAEYFQLPSEAEREAPKVQF